MVEVSALPYGRDESVSLDVNVQGAVGFHGISIITEYGTYRHERCGNADRCARQQPR
jgi:hypothetical protein